jgi:RNA polymerase sigma factor (sigma-70 family)
MERLTDEQRDFIEGHLGLTATFAIRANPRRDCEDSLQDAVFGLARAVRTFDPSKGRFSTYAARPIAEAILKGVEESGVIRVPFRAGRRPTDGPRVAEAAALARRARPFSSLEAEAGVRFDPPHREPEPDQATVEAVQGVLSTLPGRLREVLCLRMAGQGLREVAEAMGVSSTRVQQLEARGKSEFARAWLAAEARRHHRLQEA